MAVIYAMPDGGACHAKRWWMACKAAVYAMEGGIGWTAGWRCLRWWMDCRAPGKLHPHRARTPSPNPALPCPHALH